MRNDFPNHPAGPLRHNPDPDKVLEISKPKGAWWISFFMAVLLVIGGFLTHKAMIKIAEVKARETGTPVDSSNPVGMILAITGANLAIISLLFVFMGGTKIRVRPDGIEFPADSKPPLSWNEIETVDIATLNIIGGGGEHDFLCVRLKPGVLDGIESPYSTRIMQKVRNSVNWNFEICIPQSELSLCPAHLAMEMRARLENFQKSGVLPPPPSGSKAIPQTPLQQRKD